MHKITMIFLSLLFSLILTILPLPVSVAPFNPNWCIVSLLFWNYYQPRGVNVGIAWCLGIFVDSLCGGLLGLHALSFVLIVYLFDLFCRRFYMFPMLQQSLIIGLFVVANFLIVASFTALLTDTAMSKLYLLSALTSAVSWPFYFVLGRKLNLLRS